MAMTICLYGTVVHRRRRTRPARGLAALVDDDLAARRQLDVPFSHSVFGSRPICTKMPSSATWCSSPVPRSL
jgi:hypothetical protein